MSTDVLLELKGLRLYGMASAWGDLLGQGETAALQSARWLLEHLLQAEGVDRAMRSVSYQMKAARFPMHRDLAGFDFEPRRWSGRWSANWLAWRSPMTPTTWC